MQTQSTPLPRLGVNLDHVATLRQLRGTPYPSLLEAARKVEEAGGEQITVHLREDRRHIQDQDVKMLRAELKIPLNLEMAATNEMVKFATRIMPDWVCLVPEKRQEVTTEGGLDLKKGGKKLQSFIARLKKAGIKVSLFIEPSVQAVKMSRTLGADAVELHTGRYATATQAESAAKRGRAKSELERLVRAGKAAHAAGLKSHAGHGLDPENVRELAACRADSGGPLFEEFNIGHAIVCRAALIGLESAVREMISSIHAP